MRYRPMGRDARFPKRAMSFHRHDGMFLLEVELYYFLSRQPETRGSDGAIAATPNKSTPATRKFCGLGIAQLS